MPGTIRPMLVTSRSRDSATRPPVVDEPALLQIRGLKTHFKTDDGWLHAVDGVDLTIDRGETVCVVGESGCGKTVTAMTVLKLLPMPPGKIAAGEVLWKGRDLVTASNDEMRRVRAKEIAIVFQEPMTSLNPVYSVGEQIAESLRLHEGLGRKAAMARAVEMLALVRIPTPQQRVDDYPHQFSGGMRQRVMIAIALACGPKLLFADEPTTALDVTVQAQILDLLQAQQRDRFMAMILVTHDLGVVAGRADDIAVMYAGKIVEKAPARTLFTQMRHPYTEALMKSIPKLSLPSHTRLESIAGRPPDLVHPPKGCNFAPRCPYRFEPCPTHDPRIDEGEGPPVACWLWKQAPGFGIPKRLRQAQIDSAQRAVEAATGAPEASVLEATGTEAPIPGSMPGSDASDYENPGA